MVFWIQIQKNENNVFPLIYIIFYLHSWKGRSKRKVKRFPFMSWMFSLLSSEFLQLFSTTLNYHISPNEIYCACLIPSHSRLFSGHFLSSCFWRCETWILLQLLCQGSNPNLQSINIFNFFACTWDVCVFLKNTFLIWFHFATRRIIEVCQWQD